MQSILMVHSTMVNLTMDKPKINMLFWYYPMDHFMKVRCINLRYQEEELLVINWVIDMKENGLTINLMAKEENSLVMEVNILAHSEMEWNIVLKKVELSSKRNNNHPNLWLYIENIMRCIVDNSKMDWCMVMENWLIRIKILSILDSSSEVKKKDMGLWKLLKEDWQVIFIMILLMEKVSSIGMMAGNMKVSSGTANSMVKVLSPILKATLWVELGVMVKMKTSGRFIKMVLWRNLNMWLKADLVIRVIGSKTTENLCSGSSDDDTQPSKLLFYDIFL